MSKLLKLENVVKVFKLGLISGKKIVAVNNVSFEVRKGEILGLLGESGSGKTTIARIILRLLRPTSGRVLFKDRDVWKLRNWREVKEYYRYVQGVFQDPYSSFNPRRKILSILYDALYNFYPEYRRDKDIARRYVDEVLREVGLNINMLEGKYPHQFSGGQLQRIAIARALLPRPELIVADEPVSMVDASTRIDILNILIDLKEKFGISSIVIGHDYTLAYYSSDRIIVLYKGQIVEEGPVEVLADPAHPYTKLLKSSVPTIDRRWSRTERFQGYTSEPALNISRKGCPFADRCSYRMSICEKEEPPMISLGKAKVKCWLYANS